MTSTLNFLGFPDDFVSYWHTKFESASHGIQYRAHDVEIKLHSTKIKDIKRNQIQSHSFLIVHNDKIYILRRASQSPNRYCIISEWSPEHKKFINATEVEKGDIAWHIDTYRATIYKLQHSWRCKYSDKKEFQTTNIVEFLTHECSGAIGRKLKKYVDGIRPFVVEYASTVEDIHTLKELVDLWQAHEERYQRIVHDEFNNIICDFVNELRRDENNTIKNVDSVEHKRDVKRLFRKWFLKQSFWNLYYGYQYGFDPSGDVENIKINSGTLVFEKLSTERAKFKFYKLPNKDVVLFSDSRDYMMAKMSQ